MKKSVLSFVILATFSLKTYGWGDVGHYTTWLLAKEMLSPAAREGVEALLKNLSADERAELAIYPDIIRRDPNWQHTANYHFADIPKGMTYIEYLQQRVESMAQTKGDMTGAGDVLLTILQAEDILRDSKSSTEDKSIALRFLVHMIGDLHQPLHLGYPEDKGGNSIEDLRLDGKPAVWNGRPVNLHGLWDYMIIGYSYEKEFGGEKVDGHKAAEIYKNILGVPTTSEQKEWAADLSPETWAMEKREHLDDIYTGLKDLNTYIPHQLPVANERIKQSATRIAAVLNIIFDPANPTIPGAEAFRAKISPILAKCKVTIGQIERLNVTRTKGQKKKPRRHH